MTETPETNALTTSQAASVPTEGRMETAAHVDGEAKPRHGDFRVGPYSAYEPGHAGYVIEEYWNDEMGWVIGNYEENGLGFSGVYDTREEAEADLRDHT